jgi:xyloglucan:xyloglucosyl transferase
MGRTRAHLLASLETFCLILAVYPSQVIGDMTDSLDMLWGHSKVEDDISGHQTVSLSLDRWMTFAFRSKNQYLFGRFDMDIKLAAKGSAGIVTTLYVSDQEMNSLSSCQSCIFN